MKLGGENLVSAGDDEIFVARFGSATGSPLWSRRFGGTGTDIGYAIAAGQDGSVVFTGLFNDTVDLGGGNLTSAGNNDIFVVKLDAAGDHLWSGRFGAENGDYGFSVAIDPDGSVLVTGLFNGTVNFGGEDLTSPGDDIFVAKFDSTGKHLWSKNFGATDFGCGYSIAAGPDGSVWVTGGFQGTFNFGNGTQSSVGDVDAFVAKLDSAGNPLWSTSSGKRTFASSGHSIAVFADGSAAVTGSFTGALNLGGGTLTSAGEDDIFIAKFDPAGTHLWSKRFGGNDSDQGNSIAVGQDGSAVVTGAFAGTLNFGGGDLTSAGAGDIFVVVFGAAGDHLWSKRFGGTGDDSGLSSASGKDGKAAISGSFTGTANFDGENLVSEGGYDIFLVVSAQLRHPPERSRDNFALPRSRRSW